MFPNFKPNYLPLKMCTNTRLIRNIYTGRSLRVNCGKCPACQQQKAGYRANRIRNNIKRDETALFITLTYKNDHIPYVYLKDLADKVENLPLYRDYNVRYKRFGSSYDVKPVSYPDGKISTLLVKYQDIPDKPFKTINSKVNQDIWNDRVGILYYKDLQNFVKRLRINLKRRYDYEKSFTFFSCSELGPTTHRPHFHCLLFIPKDDVSLFRTAIVESWPFADSSRTAKYIEVARDAASYVSSYVNRDSDIPTFFENNDVRPKHSYSKGFGLAPADFSLPKILEKADNGNMCYTKLVKRNGVECLFDVPIPEYVINRYFPKFKGSTRLAPDTLARILLYPKGLYSYKKFLDYSEDDIHKIVVRLSHARHDYHVMSGNDINQFPMDYERVWRSRASFINRHQYDDVVHPLDFGFFYDNFNEYHFGKVHSQSLDDLHIVDFELDPNLLPYRQLLTSHLTDLYYKLVKQKKVTNAAMHALGYIV